MSRRGRPAPMRRMVQAGHPFLHKLMSLSKVFGDAVANQNKGPKPYQIGPGVKNYHRRVKRPDQGVNPDVYRDTMEKSQMRDRKVRDQRIYRNGIFIGILKNMCYQSRWLPGGREYYFKHCRMVRRQRWARVMAGNGSAAR